MHESSVIKHNYKYRYSWRGFSPAEQIITSAFTGCGPDVGSVQAEL